MRRTLGLALALLAVSVAGPAAQQNRSEVMLRAAMETETVKGDLKGAIEQYKKLADGSDRVTAATALLRLAACYEKLGDLEAQKIYQRLVRDFADQQDAFALARARLRSTAVAGGAMASRRVWGTESADFFTHSTISADGRFLPYDDWTSNGLFVHDFVTGQDHPVVRPADPRKEFVEESATSRDGRQVAYSWWKADTKRYDLRVAPLDGSGTPRILYANEDVTWLMPFDWSPDGNWIAVQLARQDKTGQMGLVSVRDGSLRVLKSEQWQDALKLFFSPDGKYVGFDFPSGDGKTSPRDVLILAVDGSTQSVVATGPSNDTMVGWSPDGNFILFASDRGNSTGLWATPVREGKPQGPPIVLKADMTRDSLGVTTSGMLYSGVWLGKRSLEVATIDFERATIVGEPKKLVTRATGFAGGPVWSPDGKRLAYVSVKESGGPRYLEIQSSDEEVREFVPPFNYFQNFRWTPDGRSLITQATDQKNHQGLFRIDAQTGDVTPLVLNGGHPQPSPDGSHIYFRRQVGGGALSFLDYDVAGQSEREMWRTDLGDNFYSLSPDGQLIAAAFLDEASNACLVVLVPTGGGAPRELVRLQQTWQLPHVTWLPDGKAILLDRPIDKATDKRELTVVSVATGQPRKIDMGAFALRTSEALAVHPNGRQIVYTRPIGNSEVWTLENFLPTGASDKRSANSGR